MKYEHVIFHTRFNCRCRTHFLDIQLILRCDTSNTNMLNDPGAFLIHFALLVNFVSVNGVPLNSSHHDGVWSRTSNSVIGCTNTSIFSNITYNVIDKQAKSNISKRATEEKSEGTFIMYLDDEEVNEKTTLDEVITVKCLKKRIPDGRYSAIHAFINDKEIDQDKLMLDTLTDASSVTFEINLDLKTKTNVVKCTITSNGEEEEVTATVINERVEATKVEATAATHDYLENDLVEVLCITDGKPPPQTDLAIYNVECLSTDLPQPLMIARTNSSYVMPPACVQCTIRGKKAGEMGPKSEFLVMRMESNATSNAVGRSKPGISVYFFITYVGIIRPIMTTMQYEVVN